MKKGEDIPGPQNVTPQCRKSQEELASNYALQVALQTMKERCQQLQARLSMVEEENLQLKIDKQRQTRQETKNVVNDIDKLQEQIAQLSRQKSQLTHHIFMVATENKHLWTRLSLLTEANESLGTRLNKISTALNNHTKMEPFLNDINCGNLGGQSLEEISLKLISSIQQERSEFEQQYAESFKDCDFTLTNGDDIEQNETCDSDEEDNFFDMSNELNRVNQRMTAFRNTIEKQKETLQACVMLLKKFSKGETSCLICKKHLEEEKKLFHDEGVMTSLSEKVEKDSIDQEVQNINENSKKTNECPLGGCGYSSIVLDELVEHVLNHFPPIKIDDEFDQICIEQPPSVM